MGIGSESAVQLPVKDVLVVGGGIAGLSASIALGKRGVQTTVVERSGQTDGANIGINYRPVYALEELGILDDVLRRGQSNPVGQSTRFEAVYRASGERVPMGPPPALGDDWTLPISSVRLLRPDLSEIMKNAASSHGARLLIGHSYRSLEPQADGVAVELTNGEHHVYDLVVGADGVNSELRERFFPEVGSPTYLGRMGGRVMLEDAPAHWRTGQHISPDGRQRIVTQSYPNHRFHLAAGGKRMEPRFVDQDEARAMVRERLEPYLGADRMFDELYERITDDVHVIVTATHWIYVPPPWHRGRILLIGDAAHATAPTIGSGGGMALEDGAVLAQELAKTNDLEQALTAFANRRDHRARLVAVVSADLVRFDNEIRPNEQETALRRQTYEELMGPY